MPQNNFWDKRYEKEGEIWRQTPSLTAEFVHQSLPEGSKVFEIGFGYGRDVAFLVKKGLSVSGIENSSVGHAMASNRLAELQMPQGTNLIKGDFLKATLPKDEFDAVFSHRVIHLLKEKQAVDVFAGRATKLLKPGGMLLVSGRDARGMKPDRKGHHVSLWDENRFLETFGKDFEIETFLKGEEIESQSNPGMTFFTVMVAKRKAFTPS